MAATVGDMISQIDQATVALDAASPATRTALATGWSQNLASQISVMQNLDYPSATTLSAALQSSGFDDNQKQSLTQALFTRVMSLQTGLKMGGPQPSSGASAAAMTSGAQCQSLESVLEYHTAADYAAMEKFSEEHNTSAIILVPITRVSKLGVSHASEQTIKALVALIMSYTHPDDMPTATESHSIVTQVKTSLKAMGRRIGASTPLASMVVYPNTPCHLPSHIRAQAYDESDPPISKVMPRFYSILKCVALRIRVYHILVYGGVGWIAGLVRVDG